MTYTASIKQAFSKMTHFNTSQKNTTTDSNETPNPVIDDLNESLSQMLNSIEQQRSMARFLNPLETTKSIDNNQ